MKVVRNELIKDKINEEINRGTSVYGEIVRIELNQREFSDFVEQVDSWYAVLLNRCPMRTKAEIPMNGDYLVWRGVCIQHHESYD
jgi:hypothetical protein